MSEQLFPETDATVDSIDAETLFEQVEDDDDVTLLDVRASSEYDDWHIDGENVDVANVPYFEFLDDVDDDLLDRVPDGDPVVVVCAKGGASEYIAAQLEDNGFDAVNMDGGMNEWARLYFATEVDADTDATVLQYQRPSSGCLSHMVVSDGEALVADPLREFTDRYVADAADHGAELRYAVDTHIHADHISGARELANEVESVEAAYPQASLDRGAAFDPDVVLEDGDELAVGDVAVQAVFTPGHTTGMTSYLVDDAALFTGDFLFTESVARPDLEDGDEGAPDAARLLYDSLQTLREFDDDVVVAPGHFSDAATPAADGTYTATLGELFDEMSALSMDKEDFVDFVLSDMPSRPANYEDIIATNLGEQDPDADEAFELELGPNNCAASKDAMTE
ncbi:MBL fold metallo-hydrolase [Halorubellus litoreus]|uniref:MBL fold metallo-hydrolase n=1 Tax=Halorubellus litoreus TaxID=755308 RepID=A0ABD5VBT6_9EURY